MKYAFLTIRKIPLALVLASEEEYNDEFVAHPPSIQLQLNRWVVIVKNGFYQPGHPNYADYRAGLENIGFSPAFFLAELLLADEPEWIDLPVEEAPF